MSVCPNRWHKRPCQAKVSYLAGVGLSIHEYVLGLQVPVQDAHAVHSIQALEDLVGVELQSSQM